ncbi:MAG: UDP-2,3-diacylglucosamine diphosphatase LpxI [Rickettsiales bacterium]|jgi:DUF1009 family protein|nr:UDP-2,3-diacylglucosamine diphosphatase LpxI [Rickettsiales bacterium]
MIRNRKIALIAGALRLPLLVAADLRREGYDVFVIGIKNFCDPALGPDMWVRLGAAGTALRELKKRGISQITMAGALGHPNLSDIRPDLASVGILARILKNQKGYDSMLAALIAEIEKLGFSVVAAQKLCPNLTFDKGVQTKRKPSKDDLRDIRRGMEVSKAIGKLDIGQSAVVRKQVLAVEAAEGTAKMLERVIGLGKNRAGRGGVLVKLVKPGQDLRADIPAIGTETVLDAAAAKLNGIVVNSKNCWAIDRDEIVRLANRHKIFIVAE